MPVDIPPFGARTVLWAAAQLHLFFAAFILGAPIFIVISEYLGVRLQDPRYERLARETMKAVGIAYSFTAIFGVMFAFILMGPFQASTNYLMKRFFPVFGAYGALILVESAVMYAYWYSWDALDTPRGKKWHIGLGVLLNVVGTVLMLVMNAVAAYMLTPPRSPETAGLWQMINNPSWSGLNLHRFIGNLTFGGFMVALFAAFMFLTAKDDEDRAFYDWMGFIGNFIGTGTMMIIPVAGYIYARELFHYDASISTLLMADKLSWFFEVQGVLVGLLFLGANYYMWLSIQRIEGSVRFGSYMKTAFAVMIVGLAIWITPQAFLPDLSTSPSGGLGITELAIPSNLAFLGLMMAKALAVTAIVIFTFVTYLVYRRALATGRIAWGRIDVRAQYTLIFLPAVAVYTMGLMGAIRELARGDDFIFRVVKDPSPYWYIPPLGYTSQVTGAVTLIFFVLMTFIFWLGFKLTHVELQTADRGENPNSEFRIPKSSSRWPLIAVAGAIALVWLIPAVLPEDSGWRLGLPFRLFYTAIAILSGLFFLLLEAPAPRQPRSGPGVLAGIGAVYLATVGFLVGIGMIFPQFQVPSEQVVALDLPAERGKAMFFDSATTCILCHAVEGQGGTRGPDLSGVATRAGTRVEGLSAEEYIRQSILDPTAFVVEGYDPIMPPGLIKVIGEENLGDLVAFLLTLK